MSKTTLTTRPLCGSPLEAGFAARPAGLSFIEPAKLEQSASLDEDLPGAGPKQ